MVHLYKRLYPNPITILDPPAPSSFNPENPPFLAIKNSGTSWAPDDPRRVPRHIGRPEVDRLGTFHLSRNERFVFRKAQGGQGSEGQKQSAPPQKETAFFFWGGGGGRGVKRSLGFWLAWLDFVFKEKRTKGHRLKVECCDFFEIGNLSGVSSPHKLQIPKTIYKSRKNLGPLLKV